MNHKKLYFSAFLFIGLLATAQKTDGISESESLRIISILASDEMQGRQVFTPGIDSASAFIESEFKNIGLSYYGDLQSYRQEFRIKRKATNNVIGVLPGKTKPEEFVIFSAHFDHLGVAESGEDKVYNGANDDASGVTAVIMLARYFKELADNDRTLIFAAFTAEEIGAYGSAFFAKQIKPDNVSAMFNIEMIGTDSKWGRNSAYITGFEKSNFGEILQKNLEGSSYAYYPDPYPDEKLFFRSDNVTLAFHGVPAHTITTSKMDNEINYHQPSDEVSTLDLANMTEIIKSIVISSKNIIKGIETPERISRKKFRQ